MNDRYDEPIITGPPLKITREQADRITAKHGCARDLTYLIHWMTCEGIVEVEESPEIMLQRAAASVILDFTAPGPTRPISIKLLEKLWTALERTKKGSQ